MNWLLLFQYFIQVVAVHETHNNQDTVESELDYIYGDVKRPWSVIRMHLAAPAENVQAIVQTRNLKNA